MTETVLRHVSIIACLAGLAVATVFFIAVLRGTPTPQWMPVVLAMIGGYELVQWGQSFWFRREER